jgi:hypothetical protein
MKSNANRAILLGGLLCGALDLTAAIVVYGLMRGRSPILIMQSIASGLLGAKSYDGDAASASLGVFLHFFIAFSAAAVFYFVSRKLHFLVQYAIACGILYGIAVYFFMQLIVLPLSAFPHKSSFVLTWVGLGVIIHIFCVGLPISLATRKYSQ